MEGERRDQKKRRERRMKKGERSFIWQKSISLIQKQKCQYLETYTSQPNAYFYYKFL